MAAKSSVDEYQGARRSLGQRSTETGHGLDIVDSGGSRSLDKLSLLYRVLF